MVPASYAQFAVLPSVVQTLEREARLEKREARQLPRCSRLIGEHKSQCTLARCHCRTVCSKPIKFVASQMCEDCYAEVAGKFHGDNQRAKV